VCLGAGLALNHPGALSSSCAAPPTHARYSEMDPTSTHVHSCALTNLSASTADYKSLTERLLAPLIATAHGQRLTVFQRHRALSLVLGLGTGSAGKLGASHYHLGVSMRQCSDITVQTVSAPQHTSMRTCHTLCFQLCTVRVKVSVTCCYAQW
jgi:hypothetical protein